MEITAKEGDIVFQEMLHMKAITKLILTIQIILTQKIPAAEIEAIIHHQTIQTTEVLGLHFQEIVPIIEVAVQCLDRHLDLLEEEAAEGKFQSYETII